VIDHVHAGRLARDGDTLIDLGGETLRERRKLMWNGSAAATLVIDKQGRPVSAPVVSLRGIEDADGTLAEAIVDGLKEMLADLSAGERRDNGRIEEAASQAVRRIVRSHLGKKPLTDVHIVRI
jgi:ribonuclease J